MSSTNPIVQNAIKSISCNGVYILPGWRTKVSGRTLHLRPGVVSGEYALFDSNGVNIVESRSKDELKSWAKKNNFSVVENSIHTVSNSGVFGWKNENRGIRPVADTMADLQPAFQSLKNSGFFEYGNGSIGPKAGCLEIFIPKDLESYDEAHQIKGIIKREFTKYGHNVAESDIRPENGGFRVIVSDTKWS